MLRTPVYLYVCGLIVLAVACTSKPSLPVPPPAAMASNGCWVQIFEEENLDTKEAWDVLNGPAKFSTLYGLPGAREFEWGDRIESLVVGPHARVTLWNWDYFRAEKVQFGPGSRVKSLSAYAFEHEPESMVIEYVP